MINIWKYPNLINILEYLYVNGINNVSHISLNLNMAHSNSSNALKLLAQIKLVKMEVEGRNAYYELTEIGSEIGKRIKKINVLLEENRSKLLENKKWLKIQKITR